jgi:hypothetical protein
MHQDIEITYYQLPELINFWFHAGGWDNLPNMVKLVTIHAALKCLQMAMDYADDGNDPIEYLEMGNKELDFIDWFIGDLDAEEMGNANLPSNY